MKINNLNRRLLFFEDSQDIYLDNDIYKEDNAEDFSDNDEISSAEEGFMVGYLAA